MLDTLPAIRKLARRGWQFDDAGEGGYDGAGWQTQRRHNMRVLLKVTMAHEAFNAAVLDGSVGKKMQRILAEQKPEAAYFTEFGGKRTGLLIVDLPEVSKIPALAEPWFLTFKADVEFHPVMTSEDLAKAGLDALGQKWR
jgi:hypothetical protein